MKNFLLSIVAVLCVTYVSGQGVRKVQDIRYKYWSGAKNSLTVTVLSTNTTKVLDKIKHSLELSAENTMDLKGELYFDNVLIKEISDDRMDVYVAMQRGKKETSMLICAFDLGNEVLTTKNKKAVAYLLDISKSLSKETLEKDMIIEQQKLDAILLKINEQENKIKDHKSGVERLKVRLKSARASLKQVKTDLDGNIETVTKRGATATGKELILWGREKEKLEKNSESLTREIAKIQEEITKLNLKIPDLHKEIQRYEARKYDQEKKVVYLQSKLKLFE